MRILFDQGTPVPICRYLAEHTVGISADLGWARLRNGDLLATAEQAGYELLLTTDKNLRYQQNLNQRKIAIVARLISENWTRRRLGFRVSIIHMDTHTIDSAALVPSAADGLARIRGLVLDSVVSAHSRRAYAKALDDFLAWYAAGFRGPFGKAIVQQYRGVLDQQGLAASTINVRMAAIRKLASEAADNGLLDPVLAAGIAKVRGMPGKGVRAGNWLTREQARLLLLAPDAAALKGKRDRAMLGVLMGCGLRRSELVALTLDHLQQREARWVLIDLAGKGNRLRSVPVPGWVKVLIDDWLDAVRIAEGKIFRAIDKVGRCWGTGITEKVVWWTVLEYAKPLGFEKLAPHDLRRTCAKLCRASGGDLEQIQLLLGHASIQTTERYLGTKQNLTDAVNDRLGIELV